MQQRHEMSVPDAAVCWCVCVWEMVAATGSWAIFSLQYGELVLQNSGSGWNRRVTWGPAEILEHITENMVVVVVVVVGGGGLDDNDTHSVRSQAGACSI